MNKDTTKNKALVVGDLMLDESIFGDANRLTPEGPVPVILKSKTEMTLGGVGFVARILANLGINVSISSVIGKDDASKHIIECCKEDGIDSSQIIHSEEYKSIKKTRIYASGHLVARIDDEEKFYMTETLRISYLEKVSNLLKSGEFKVCIISDYDKGFCNPKFIKKIIALCKENNIITLVDPKTKDVNKFKGASLIKPNSNEAAKILGVSLDDLPKPENVVENISKSLDISNVLFTRGSKGMILYSEGSLTDISAVKQEVFNVVGAGDTVIAGLCAGLISGFSIKESSLIANDLAGEIVSKLSRKIKPSKGIRKKLGI